MEIVYFEESVRAHAFFFLRGEETCCTSSSACLRLTSARWGTILFVCTDCDMVFDIALAIPVCEFTAVWSLFLDCFNNAAQVYCGFVRFARIQHAGSISDRMERIALSSLSLIRSTRSINYLQTVRLTSFVRDYQIISSTRFMSYHQTIRLTSCINYLQIIRVPAESCFIWSDLWPLAKATVKGSLYHVFLRCVRWWNILLCAIFWAPAGAFSPF